jgi:hypothetical protein
MSTDYEDTNSTIANLLAAEKCSLPALRFGARVIASEPIFIVTRNVLLKFLLGSFSDSMHPDALDVQAHSHQNVHIICAS